MRSFCVVLTALATVLAACTAPTGGAPSATTAAPASASAPAAAAKAQIFVFSNSSPQVSVIDGESRKVLRTAADLGIKSWTWNDDNNYFDGKDLWLGTRDPDTSEATVILLDLDSLTIDDRIPLGKEATTLYIGKPTKDGLVFVAKHASWQMAVIDAKTHKLMKYVDVPTNAGTTGKAPQWAVCDSDSATGPDGITRIYYPTSFGTTTVAIDAATGAVLKTQEHPAGSRPCMLTVAPDKNVWVQECDGNNSAILDPVTLEVIKRVPSGKYPVVAAFSPDGKYAYIGHGTDPIVQVLDTKSFAEVARVQVGTTPDRIASHPNGRWLFAEVSKEASVAVIDTTTWTVAERIPLGTNPSGIFARRLP